MDATSISCHSLEFSQEHDIKTLISGHGNSLQVSTWKLLELGTVLT